MSFEAEKLNVLQQIINSDDVKLIKGIKSFISNRDMDWFDTLTNAQQDDVNDGINQLDQVKFFSHNEARKRFVSVKHH